MATIALSAAGMALGGSIGGSVLGLSMATLGRAAGAALGRRIDQQILGGGSDAVETGRIDRFRLTGATEGADVQQIYGRMRVAGQVIWATQFLESSSTSSGGKGGSSQPSTTTYSYTVSLAVALCEGTVGRVGRIWADGTEVSPASMNIRFYPGSEDQQPDPKISAVEGLDNTPAFRGTAYVVIEDLALGQFGNRIPQLTFEVVRAATVDDADVTGRLRGTVLGPATGEYALATSQVHVSGSYGEQEAINTNSPLGGSDFTVSMDALQGDLPQCGSVVMPVAWFGNDLRCSACAIVPMVEQTSNDADAMPWKVSGTARSGADVLPQMDDVPVYAGTPADAAVVEAIADLHDRGLSVVMQPKVLMVQTDDNSLTNPWTGLAGQPSLPWCGDVTTTRAYFVDGTPDWTAQADIEVAAFFGNADASDFEVSGSSVTYSGPADTGYRRFVLHYAHLCAAAGGVDAFCIGTDLRGLTTVRGAGGEFPAVTALVALAADVRAILGTNCQISYAADWDEYQGFAPLGTTDRYFPLDTLWADPNVDFVGVNARMPLADWRDGEAHLDADAGAVYDLAYLSGNVAGGEDYDWTYPTSEARDAQLRSPITDPEGEDWILRRKDIQGWWGNSHHPRIDGLRQTTPSAWVPCSKPIWFTQMGCAAIDKGANLVSHSHDIQPHYSNGNRDDLMQMQYLQALTGYYEDDANNPTSDVYGGQMIALDRMYALGWDVRPFPYWPGNQTMWHDGADYTVGPWLNGRATNRTLASVVAEICTNAGVAQFDTSALFGVVRGYSVSDNGTGRSALQPLMLAHGFDAIERDGVLQFRNRRAAHDHDLDNATLAIDPEADQTLALTRAAAAEVAGRVQIAHLHADGDYDAIAAEAVLPDETTIAITRNELPLAMTRQEGEQIVHRWLQEARVARDTAKFALPPSQANVGAGDIVSLQTPDHTGFYRIDLIEEAGLRLAEATRIDKEVYRARSGRDETVALQPYIGPIPAEMVFMDLPLLTGDELPHAPYVAATGRPWPGSIALYSAPQDSDYSLLGTLNEASTLGVTQSALGAGPVGIWDRQSALEVNLVSGSLSSATHDAVLAGANTIAVGDGSGDNWEIMQFQNALPISTQGYALSGLLRGQLGSWGLMPAMWSAGSKVVLLNGVQQQLALASATRGTMRHFRYGPASQPIDDASYRYATHAFAGNGLRPYPVVHLKAVASGSDVVLNWIRATRIDGDLWADGDVPLGEDSETYLVRVIKNGVVLREDTVSTSTWLYDQSEVGSGSYDVAVAQVSARFGAGPFTAVTIT